MQPLSERQLTKSINDLLVDYINQNVGRSSYTLHGLLDLEVGGRDRYILHVNRRVDSPTPDSPSQSCLDKRTVYTRRSRRDDSPYGYSDVEPDTRSRPYRPRSPSTSSLAATSSSRLPPLIDENALSLAVIDAAMQVVEPSPSFDAAIPCFDDTLTTSVAGSRSGGVEPTIDDEALGSAHAGEESLLVPPPPPSSSSGHAPPSLLYDQMQMQIFADDDPTGAGGVGEGGGIGVGVIVGGVGGVCGGGGSVEYSGYDELFNNRPSSIVCEILDINYSFVFNL